MLHSGDTNTQNVVVTFFCYNHVFAKEKQGE